MQTNPTAEQSKIVRWSESPWNQSGKKGKGLWRKDLLKSQVLSSERNSKQVREDASGDSEDGEDDSCMTRLRRISDFCF